MDTRHGPQASACRFRRGGEGRLTGSRAAAYAGGSHVVSTLCPVCLDACRRGRSAYPSRPRAERRPAQHRAVDRESREVSKGKRTFQPNNRRRARTHGFRLRMRTRAGRAIVAGRRRKGRERLSA